MTLAPPRLVCRCPNCHALYIHEGSEVKCPNCRHTPTLVGREDEGPAYAMLEERRDVNRLVRKETGGRWCTLLPDSAGGLTRPDRTGKCPA